MTPTRLKLYVNLINTIKLCTFVYLIYLDWQIGLCVAVLLVGTDVLEVLRIKEQTRDMEKLAQFFSKEAVGNTNKSRRLN